MSWRRWLNVAITVFLLGLATWLLDWKEVGTAIRTVQAVTFAEAVALSLVIVPILGLRWHLMTRHLAQIPLSTHLRLYAFATFLNVFTPANLGGDVYRVFLFSRQGVARGPVVAQIVRERLLGFVSYLLGFLLAYGAALLTGRVHTEFTTAAAIVSATLLAIGVAPWLLGRAFVFLPETWSPAHPQLARVVRLALAATTFRSVSDFLGLMLISLVALVGWISVMALLAHALGLSVPLPTVAMAAILTEIIRLLPLTIQGIGLREAAFASFVGLAGGSPEAAFVTAAIAYLALSFALLLCGFARWSSGRIPANPASEAQ